MKKYYSGKARDMYLCDDGNIVIVATDRVSVHTLLPYMVEHKGRVLNKMSEYWFNKFNSVISNHMISTNVMDMPSFFNKDEFKDRCMLVKKLNMFKVECIVRGHITGTCWEKYCSGKSICGIELPEGLQLSQKLDTAIFTPTTKEDDGTDKEIPYEEFENIVGIDYASKIKTISIQIYNEAYEYCFSRGIILADTKMEFGLDEEGNLVLGDELLTPDCSRFWLLKDFKIGEEQTNFDREELRYYIESNLKSGKDVRNSVPKEIICRISDKYLNIYKIITGKSLDKK